MTKNHIIISIALSILLCSCSNAMQDSIEDNSASHSTEVKSNLENPKEALFETEDIYGLNACRYQVPADSWNNLSLKDKKLTYYLTQAGLAGRDLYSNQLYEHNLEVMELISLVHEMYEGDTDTEEWKSFDEYTKRAWMRDGIFDSDDNSLYLPYFPKEWFINQLAQHNYALRPELEQILFPEDKNSDSANSNFYSADITLEEAKEFYTNYSLKKNEHDSLEYGLNSKLVRNKNGQITESRYYVNGLGAESIKNIIFWLAKAKDISDNLARKSSIESLIKYYETGEIQHWEQHNIEWLKVEDVAIDFSSGFVEYYEDPLARKGSFESLVYILDKEYSKKLKDLSSKRLWFEQNAPIPDKYKRKVSKSDHSEVVYVIGAAGATTPYMIHQSSLPNSEWVRNRSGTKSIIFKNILDVDNANASQGVLIEFANDEDEVIREIAHGSESSILTSSLKMMGLNFAQKEESADNPSVPLAENTHIIDKIISKTFTLYFSLDKRLVDFGIMSSTEVGKCTVDRFLRTNHSIRWGNEEEATPYSNSSFIASQAITNWLIQKGEDSCIEVLVREGKTYLNITNYNVLQNLLGELLKTAVKIKATGNFEESVNLSALGQIVPYELAKEFYERKNKLNISLEFNKIQPMLNPVYNENGEITDVKISYDTPFTEQMLKYREEFGFMRKLTIQANNTLKNS